MSGSGAIVTALAVLAVAPRCAGAQDTFEIQVYDAALTETGHVETDYHLNETPLGAREPGFTATPGAFHATLETVYGASRLFEVGGYFLTAWNDVGPVVAGVHARARVRTPPWWTSPLAASLNLELARDADAYAGGSPWSLEVRPILDYRAHHLLAVVNPIVVFALSGPARSAIPDFEPCLHVGVRPYDTWDVGAEYYTGLGPLTRLEPPSSERHYVYAAGDVQLSPHVALNVGVGHGLTRTSAALVTKAIVELVF